MDKKMVFFLILCICLSMGIIGVTYAYFTAKAVDETTVYGSSESVTFGLKVEKVTTADMAFGLIPMKNNQAPGAAYNKCLDDNDNAGCQIYKVTVTSNSDTVMFLDGYVVTTPRGRLETRIASVYSDDNGENFYTKFTPNDFISDNQLSEVFLTTNGINDQGIKTGAYGTNVVPVDENVSEDEEIVEQPVAEMNFNHVDAADCLVVSNQQIGGDLGNERVFYFMIWVFDNGEAQDYLQGMQLAYKGSVTFVTAEGNEIMATFD